ncbi:MAG: hypothetical protein GX813_03105 [Erysipelotrichia bacterium]|nr:hypothetical protein [Erysipelotrichia bacterium]
MSVADNINLAKFVSLDLFEGLFDENSKKEAINYVEGAIKDMHISENECYGTIVGSKEYSFKIAIGRNSFINLSCTCSKVGTCKHLYAVFLKMKQLLDRKPNKIVTTQNVNPNDFKAMLEKYFYVRSGDNIPLLGRLNFRIKNLDKCQQFIEQLTPYYLRGQYKARSINDVLAPLFFNPINAENFAQLVDVVSSDSQKMIAEASKQYVSLKNDFEKKNSLTKKVNLYHIILAPDCQALVELLTHAADNYNEERLANQVMAEYLKYQDPTIEDISLLKSTFLFQVNHHYYVADIMNGPAKAFLGTYLLFFDGLPLNENKIKQIPFDHFLRVSTYSNDKSRYVPIVYNNYENIKEENYPTLVEMLIGVALQHDFVDEHVIRLTIELSKKIPEATFINELVEANIRRQKKARVY